MTNTDTISASRVPALLGQSKWQTRLALFYELTGKAAPQEDNELLAEGRAFERTIAEIACKKFGFTLVEGPKLLQHGNLSGHPDYYVIDKEGKLAVLEIKNTLFFDVGEEVGWGDPGTDRVPIAYWFQCQTYGHLMAKTARASFQFEPGGTLEGCFSGVAPHTYLAARLRSGVQLYIIPTAPEVVAKIEAEASAFLDRVARNEPPDPEDESDFRRRWAPVPEKVAEAGPEQVAWLRAYKALKAEIKQREAEVSTLAKLILGWMQDSSVIACNGKKVGSASADRVFEAERFIAEYPTIAACYTKLDATALGKAEKKLYEQFMVRPDASVQTRKIRLNDKAIEELQ